MPRHIDLMTLREKRIGDLVERICRNSSGFSKPHLIVIGGYAIGDKSISIRVPSYQDYFLLKLFSARPSDVRDIAALVWKKGIPDAASLVARAPEILSQPQALADKICAAIADVSDSRFLDSWRGTFITEEFTEADKRRVASQLRHLKDALSG